MQWTKFTIDTLVAAEDAVCGVLYDLGYDAVEIEDHAPVHDEIQGADYEELTPDGWVDDGTARIHFYVEDGVDSESIAMEVQGALYTLRESGTDIGPGTVGVSVTRDEDWANNWKEFFHGFTVGEIYIHPSWEEPDERSEGRTVVQIDPGVSFGTGHHESTRLIIAAMPGYLKPGDSVFDVGCGSGILSVIARKLGAGFITGVDIDPDCIAASYSNMQKNGYKQIFGEFMVGDMSKDETLGGRIPEGGYDVVFANLLADIIMSMPKALYRALKPGGVLLTSGIIDFKEEQVRECLENVGFTVLETLKEGEWRSIIVKK